MKHKCIIKSKQNIRKGMANMTKPINPYKPVVDRKFIIEQAENKDMSVWEFLKGFVVVDDDVSIKKEENENDKRTIH